MEREEAEEGGAARRIWAGRRRGISAWEDGGSRGGGRIVGRKEEEGGGSGRGGKGNGVGRMARLDCSWGMGYSQHLELGGFKVGRRWQVPRRQATEMREKHRNGQNRL